MIARNVSATGLDAERVADELAQRLAGKGLALAIVFADWRISPVTLARELQRALAPAVVAGCTTVGVIGGGEGATAVALGLYGAWLRAGVSLAPELSMSPLARSRDAVIRAAEALGTTTERLDPTRHVALTFVDGNCGHEEAFCIGSAAAAPQIRVVGGSAATNLTSTTRPSYVWAHGEAIGDAGLVVALESELRFEAIASSHLVPTTLRAVVTAASGRELIELDGMPAVVRLHAMEKQLGEPLLLSRASQFSFARYVGGIPYMRSITQLEGTRVHLASGVEVGHVLHLMRAGNLVGKTKSDLAMVSDRLGGELSALLAFSCLGRHVEAEVRGQTRELAAAYAEYPTTGLQTYGEQTNMLFVNHTLTGLALGR